MAMRTGQPAAPTEISTPYSGWDSTGDQMLSSSDLTPPNRLTCPAPAAWHGPAARKARAVTPRSAAVRAADVRMVSSAMRMEHGLHVAVIAPGPFTGYRGSPDRNLRVVPAPGELHTVIRPSPGGKPCSYGPPWRWRRRPLRRWPHSSS